MDRWPLLGTYYPCLICIRYGYTRTIASFNILVNSQIAWDNTKKTIGPFEARDATDGYKRNQHSTSLTRFRRGCISVYWRCAGPRPGEHRGGRTRQTTRPAGDAGGCRPVVACCAAHLSDRKSVV